MLFAAWDAGSPPKAALRAACGPNSPCKGEGTAPRSGVVRGSIRMGGAHCSVKSALCCAFVRAPPARRSAGLPVGRGPRPQAVARGFHTDRPAVCSVNPYSPGSSSGQTRRFSARFDPSTMPCGHGPPSTAPRHFALQGRFGHLRCPQRRLRRRNPLTIG